MRELMVCAALLVGCGSDATSNNTAPTPTGIPLESFDEEFFKAECDRLFECCSAMELQAVFKMAPSATRAQCEAYLARDSEFGGVQARVAAGKATYDGKAAEACLASYRAIACANVKYAVDDASCRETFRGVTADGHACIDSRDCASNFCVGTNGGTRAGTCAAEPTEGQECPEGRCAPGLFCDFATKVCAKPRADGATCLGGHECASGYCDSSATKTCQPPPASESCWPL